MSNPAVINLASIFHKRGGLRRVQIEDNIGESIHIHINNYRLDMNIREFLGFADTLSKSFDYLLGLRGFDISNFDPYFLFRMSPVLVDIIKIDVKYMKLSDLNVIINQKVWKIGTIPVSRRLQKSFAYRYLKGSKADFASYEQDSYPGILNHDRLESLNNSIANHGYPLDGKHIVLFGDQNIIRDGQHRAAVLASIYGLNHKIPVQVVYFNGNKWRFNAYSAALKIVIDRFLSYSRNKVRQVLQKCKSGI